MKTCNKCRDPKPLAAFHKSNTTQDGRVYTCKACRAEKLDQTEVIRGCHSCVFEPECNNNINFKDWQPYCHTTAKYHEFYVNEYGCRSAAAGVAA